MKFLCLAYEDEEKLNALSQDQWDALREETIGYVNAIRSSGHLVVTQALQTAKKAATVRVRSGQTLVTEGPFAESKELIGGFFMIEAADMQEALHVAAQWPSARIGTIEVRPIEEQLPRDRRYA